MRAIGAALSSIALLALFAGGCGKSAAPSWEETDGSEPSSLTAIGEGAFPRFSPDGNTIAFTLCLDDPEDPSGVTYEIFTMRPDGTDLKCLTRDKPELSGTRWKGQPYWHPSGEYIAFTAENASLNRAGTGTASRPGLGRGHDVWIMTSDGGKFWRLTDYPENWGVIRPCFSRDGGLICWNEEYSMEKYPQGLPGDPDDDPLAPGRQGHPGSYWSLESFRYRKGEELGAWRFRIADFSLEDGEPVLSNSRTVELPQGYTLIEGAGFAPSGNQLICSCADLSETGGRGIWGDIYVIDLSGDISQRLTDTPFIHDENPEYSPDGSMILWNASQGDPGEGEDLWIMGTDGGNKTRLTHFSEPGYAEYDPNGRQITESSWSPDGERVVFGHVSSPERAGIRLPSTLYLLQMGSYLEFFLAPL
ncbi:MAG: hypothetical protein HPY75_13635 [Actinobacteria bacterium]|nr:hypothetical protein [Actinomycetota bacterium]